jgi:DNA-binding MarR family transcriptional regulator
MRPSTRSTNPAAVADRLHSAAIHLLRRLRKEDERAGISPARLSALSVLVFGGPMRLTDLAAAEQVKPPTMTRIVAGLAADGLVRRSGVSGDARAVRLEATARGVDVMQEGRRRRVARLAAALQNLSAEERRLLAAAAELMEHLFGRPDRARSIARARDTKQNS